MGELFTKTRDQLLSIWNGLPRSRRIIIASVGVLVFVAILAIALLAGRKQWRPLYSQLRPEYAGEVMSYLRDNAIPYSVGEDGATIFVPEDRLHEVRLDLASQGLPRGGVVGMELWDRTAIGETEFDRRVKYIRALQGELTRTILQIESVASARVHIVLPEHSLFSQSERPATASVLLERKPGAEITTEQVRAIAHLMATSVDGLVAENVTIVDERGLVLSDVLHRPANALSGSEGVLSRFEIERAFERDLEVRVQAMLERVFGYGNVALRVSADLNLDRQEEVFEIYEPVVDDAGLVLTEQESRESYTGLAGSAGGVAGVASNVPGYAEMDLSQVGEYSRQDASRSYVVNRKSAQVVRAPGQVERLTVAVWLNSDLPPARLAMVEQMVAAAVGLQPERGDTVTVDVMEFDPSPMMAMAGDLVATPDYVLLSHWIWYVAAAVLLLLLWMGWRRRRRALAPGGDTPVVDVVVDDNLEDELAVPRLERQPHKSLEAILEIANEEPDVVAALLRAWMDEE
ncbi:MAG: flagellar M-ring protein FliF [Firmicutes bacterium]|nr:flagellar M-ring protein FliF [Bacillota bacterium]